MRDLQEEPGFFRALYKTPNILDRPQSVEARESETFKYDPSFLLEGIEKGECKSWGPKDRYCHSLPGELISWIPKTLGAGLLTVVHLGATAIGSLGIPFVLMNACCQQDAQELGDMPYVFGYMGKSFRNSARSAYAFGCHGITPLQLISNGVLTAVDKYAIPMHPKLNRPVFSQPRLSANTLMPNLNNNPRNSKFFTDKELNVIEKLTNPKIQALPNFFGLIKSNNHQESMQKSPLKDRLYRDRLYRLFNAYNKLSELTCLITLETVNEENKNNFLLSLPVNWQQNISSSIYYIHKTCRKTEMEHRKKCLKKPIHERLDLLRSPNWDRKLYAVSMLNVEELKKMGFDTAGLGKEFYPYCPQINQLIDDMWRTLREIPNAVEMLQEATISIPNPIQSNSNEIKITLEIEKKVGVQKQISQMPTGEIRIEPDVKETEDDIPSIFKMV